VFPRWHFEKFDGSQDIFLHPQNVQFRKPIPSWKKPVRRPGEYNFVGTSNKIHPKKLGVILSIPVLGVFGSFGQKIHLLHTFSQEFPLFRN
jgi:hypothetical protein